MTVDSNPYLALAVRPFTAPYEGGTISYLFGGEVRGDRMSVTALLGGASAQNAGIVNRSRFGAGCWRAPRMT